MICVSKNFKFLGCADLTTTTVVLGALMGVAAIIILATVHADYKWFSVWSLVFAVSCATVLIQRHNILLRKVLIGIFAVEVLAIVAQIVWFIVDVVHNHKIDDDYVNDKLGLIVGFSIGAALRLVILRMLGAALYFGLKEQILH